MSNVKPGARTSPSNMADYDALPAPLRAWLRNADANYSARQAGDILRRQGGDVRKALREINRRMAAKAPAPVTVDDLF